MVESGRSCSCSMLIKQFCCSLWLAAHYCEAALLVLCCPRSGLAALLSGTAHPASSLGSHLMIPLPFAIPSPYLDLDCPV